MQLTNAFEVPILYHKEKLTSHDTIKNWILNMYSKSPVMDGNFYGTGFTTHFYNDFTSELHVLDEFFPLRNHILQKASEYAMERIMRLKSMGCEVQTDPRLKIKKMWFNVNPKHGYQGRHHHGGFILAGTYYVNVPQYSGAIEFTDPNPFSYYKNQSMGHRWLLNNYYSVTPEEGDLLIWPGYLDHEVKTNKSNDLRMTVSFCLDWEEECPQ